LILAVVRVQELPLMLQIHNLPVWIGTLVQTLNYGSAPLQAVLWRALQLLQMSVMAATGA
jgi:hypothetical protein